MRRAILGLALVGCWGCQSAPPEASPPDATASLDPAADYAAAVDLVRAGQVERYDEALALLAGVPSEHPLYPDAQAYTQWIGADRLVRAAAQAFDRGEVERALAHLDEALLYPVLGPEAKDSVRVRRLRWLHQTRAARAGLRALEAGQPERARGELQRLREADSEALRRLARCQLQHLDDGARPPPDVIALGDQLLALDAARIDSPDQVGAEKDDWSHQAWSDQGAADAEGWDGWEQDDWESVPDDDEPR